MLLLLGTSNSVSAKMYRCPVEDTPGQPVFHQDVDDVSRFYVCINGKAEVHQCADSLYFNEESQQCDLVRHEKSEL